MKSAIAWRIDGSGPPAKLARGEVDYEKHLEDWIDADIQIVADDVLVIGRQVVTVWKTQLDLLGVDRDGNLVVIELKRDQTLRETVAQGLEYAAWASGLGHEDLMSLGRTRFGTDDEFLAAFQVQFGVDLPETVNGLQRVLIVAPTIDDRTATVIDYLAETYRVQINAVSFDVFGPAGDRVLVRHFVREQSDPPPPPPSSKKQPKRSLDEFRTAAERNGVLAAFNALASLEDILPSPEPFYRSYSMRRKTPDGRLLSGVSIYPDARNHAIELSIYPSNLSALTGLTGDQARSCIESLSDIAEVVPSKDQVWYKVVLHGEQGLTAATRLRAWLTAGADDSGSSRVTAAPPEL